MRVDPTRALPPQLIEQARRFEDAANKPAEPRNAASVILMRGSADLEVYLLVRHLGMAFAGGMVAFPGGGVDPRDAEDAAHWAGPTPAEWASRLGVEPELAHSLVLAAIRETFEESGVLLAGETADSVVADTTGDDWEADRHALIDREQSLSEFLQRRELVARTDLLVPWACWLTPIFEPRRFRAWFFLAVLPEGQVTRDVSTEASEVMWLDVREALARAHRDEFVMLPPQYYTLLELLAAPSPTDAMALGRRREVELVMPAARFDGEVGYLEVPEQLVELAARVVEEEGW